MALLANALISVPEFLGYLGKALDAQDDDKNRAELCINSASSAIASYIRRTICPVQAAADEIFTGDGTIEYNVKGLHISGTLVIYYWDSTDWTEMTAANYPRTFSSDERRIWFTQGHTFWRPSSSYRNNFKINYTHGYKIQDVPPEIKQACMALSQRAMLKAEGREGIASESFGDSTTSYEFKAWPDHIKALLASYRRVTFGRS